MACRSEFRSTPTPLALPLIQIKTGYCARWNGLNLSVEGDRRVETAGAGFRQSPNALLRATQQRKGSAGDVCPLCPAFHRMARRAPRGAGQRTRRLSNRRARVVDAR